MASYLLRRSGLNVGVIAECLGWKADRIYQVGIGRYHYEIEVLKAEWPTVCIDGCEPHPEIVKELFKVGGYPGTVHGVAIGNRVGWTTLHAKPHHGDGSSLFDLKEETKDYRVPITTLDALFPKPFKGRVLLWLDCEGSELAALEGGENMLKHVDVVNVELTANPPGANWCDMCKTDKHLVERGFFAIHIHTHRLSAGQCDVVYVKKQIFNPKFCCVPGEVNRFYLEGGK